MFPEKSGQSLSPSGKELRYLNQRSEIESHSTLAFGRVFVDHEFSAPVFQVRRFPFVLGDTVVNTLRLADLTPGTSAIVTAISGASRIASRLMEMGFVPGSVVEVLRRAPFGGPVQYRVHGVSISMRSAEAACVSVESSANGAMGSVSAKSLQPIAG